MGDREPGFSGRMKVYLGEMYPVPQRLAIWAIYCLTFVTFLARLHGLSPLLLSPYTASSIVAIFFFGLILRLMDELKDREVDRELFRDRPLPSGRVCERDIKISLAVAMGCFLLVNAWMGKAFVMALVLLGYSLLMFKFFFIPGILKRYFLLNLATHNPVTALMLLHVVFIFSVEQGLPLGQVKWPATILLIVMYWSMLFAREIARKIRSREEENAYVTYSQILGRKGAVLVAAGAQTGTFLVVLYLTRRLSLSPVFPMLQAIA
jgi:4-hydroxybenzoate polyprenyltransferase